jgi:hypothetical protein
MKTKSANSQDFFSGIDYARLDTLKPVQQCVRALNLPPLRQRKLNGILNALTMQIEDGGDSSEVNNLLIKALRVAVIAQVGDKSAAATLKALAQFEQSEAARLHGRKVT